MRRRVLPREEGLELRLYRLLQHVALLVRAHRRLVLPQTYRIARGRIVDLVGKPSPAQARNFSDLAHDVLVGAFKRIPRSRLELAVNNPHQHGFLLAAPARRPRAGWKPTAA